MTLSFCSWLADCGEARPQLPDQSRLVARPLPLLPSHSLTQVFLLLILDQPLSPYLQSVQTVTTHPHAPVCHFCSLVSEHGILEGVLTKIKKSFLRKQASLSSILSTYHGNKHPLIRHSESQQFHCMVHDAHFHIFPRTCLIDGSVAERSRGMTD